MTEWVERLVADTIRDVGEAEIARRYHALLAALDGLMEPIHHWRENDNAGYDQAIGLLCATEDTIRDLLRQDRDGEC